MRRLELPLLNGVTGAEELVFNGSLRWTDYDSYGGDTTYKLGLLYTPVRGVSFRASQGTSYRALALFEQFLGSTSGFLSSQTDPCNDWGAGDPTSTLTRNCASEGLPPDFQATTGVQVNTLGGAQAGLKAETSKNLTLGVILQPALPKGGGDFSFAVDYFDIKVDNGVDRAGEDEILSRCYDDPQFISGGGYCRLISRTPVGTNRALTVNDSYINLSSDIVKGYDFALRYVYDLGPGQIIANGRYTKFTERAYKLFPDDPLTNTKGILSSPDQAGVLDLTYRYQGWRFRYGLEWIGSMSSYKYFEEDPATSTYKMDTPSYTLHNVSVEYTGNKWSVIAGVRNLADKEPPSISSGFDDRRGNALLYSGFDYFGRSYFVNAQFTF